MESKIPLPTDNIYKFYALFGLVLFVSSLAAFLYLHKTTNELIFEAAIAVEELESKESPSKAEIKRKEMLEKRVTVAVEDRKFFNTVLAFALGAAISLAGYGFWKWKTDVQPRQDRLLELQIQKAEQDIKQLRRRAFSLAEHRQGRQS